MAIPHSDISRSIARRILADARKQGVSVDQYVRQIAESKTNGSAGPNKLRHSSIDTDSSASLKWLEANAQAYTGKWVVLDSGRFIGSGNDPVTIVESARQAGVLVPFVKFIPPDEPFSGMWL